MNDRTHHITNVLRIRALSIPLWQHQFMSKRGSNKGDTSEQRELSSQREHGKVCLRARGSRGSSSSSSSSTSKHIHKKTVLLLRGQELDLSSLKAVLAKHLFGISR